MIELEMIVAKGAGNGSAAGQIFTDKRSNHLALESLLGVDQIVWNAEMLGDAASVVDVIHGAAAALRNGFGKAKAGVVGRQTALVPKLEGETHDGISLGMQERCDGRRVDAAGHGYGYGALLRHKPLTFLLLLECGPAVARLSGCPEEGVARLPPEPFPHRRFQERVRPNYDDSLLRSPPEERDAIHQRIISGVAGDAERPRDRER